MRLIKKSFISYLSFFGIVCFLFLLNFTFSAISFSKNHKNEIRTNSPSKKAELYLRDVFKIIKSNSLMSKNVDWKKVQEEAFQLAANARKTSDTYPAINFILDKLGDNHSFFIEPITSQDCVKEKEKLQTSFEHIKGEMVHNKIGYILLPNFSGKEQDAVKYVLHLNTIIRHLAKNNPCGWVVDLRQNSGGNMWPMLAGIGPLVGEGELGSFIDSQGRSNKWSYKKGDVLLEQEVIINLPPGALHISPSSPYVAVLISSNTASSGEAIAVSFKNRPHTRFFGQKTAGLSTSNQIFTLKDGAELVLTTAFFADRLRNIYDTGITPDEFTTDEKGQESTSLQKAINWLLDQSKCQKLRKK